MRLGMRLIAGTDPKYLICEYLPHCNLQNVQVLAQVAVARSSQAHQDHWVLWAIVSLAAMYYSLTSAVCECFWRG